jgi:pimeloyl-ACP methyl ester carboxylesterase
MGPRAMGDFVVRIAGELGLDRPHVVGPDIGTGALLFAAATHPEAFRSVVVGAGAATFPLHVDGALKAFVDAASIEDFRGADPGEIIQQVVSSIRNYAVPDAVRDDYLKSYAGERFVDSIAYVRNYPTDLAALSPLLAGITTPVQIIVGRDDPYGLADDAGLLHEQLPHSRLDVFDCGTTPGKRTRRATPTWSLNGSRLRSRRCDLGEPLRAVPAWTEGRSRSWPDARDRPVPDTTPLAPEGDQR